MCRVDNSFIDIRNCLNTRSGRLWKLQEVAEFLILFSLQAQSTVSHASLLPTSEN